MTINPPPLLEDLANRFDCDKGTVFGNRRAGNAYTPIYELLFRPLHDRPITLLEFGLSIGGPENGGDIDRKTSTAPSVEMWLAYFSQAKVIGFDISDFSWLRRDRFTFVRGDCGNSSDLARLSALAPFDVVIDDASHASFHQQLAFAEVFPLVRPGGLYIIEDLGWQPSAYERTLPPTPRTGDVLDAVCLEQTVPAGTVAGVSGALALASSITVFTDRQLARISRLVRHPSAPDPKPRPWYKRRKPPVVKLAVIQKRP